MAKTAVSVILPCYNVAPYLERCMDGVLRQSYEDFEVILVNDGSTDETGALCDKYAAIPNVTVIHQDNKGVSVARNSGLERASGRCIMFVDPDDTVECTLIEDVMFREKETQADAVCFGFTNIVVKKDEESGRSVHCPREKHVIGNSKVISDVLPSFVGISSDDFYEWYRTRRLAPKKEFASVWRVLYKRQILDRHRIRFEPKAWLGQDNIFNTHYLSYCNSFATLGKCLYNYYARETGALKRTLKDAQRLANCKVALLEAREHINEELKANKNIDISELYAGSTILSTLQLAAELSHTNNASFNQRFQLFRRYADSPPVRRAVRRIKLQGAPAKFRIPVYMLKHRAFLPLFSAFATAQRLGVEIRP